MAMDPRKRHNDLSNQLMRVIAKELKMPTGHDEEMKNLEVCLESVHVQGTKSENERACNVLVALLNVIHKIVRN